MQENNILTQIISTKHEEIHYKKSLQPLEALKAKLEHTPAARDFVKPIQEKIRTQQPAIIAEIKKASPSKGIIRQDFDPVSLAKNYTNHGATCLSILTDSHYFQGNDQFISAAKKVCHLPILRKDFIVDSYQIYETRLLGGDCILLIVAALTKAQLIEYTLLAHSLGLAVLVECHNEKEVEIALHLPTPLIGINNRDLKTFHTSLKTTLNLLSLIPKNFYVITESGIHTREDVELMLNHQVYGFLVGESLMRADNPGEKLQSLFYP